MIWPALRLSLLVVTVATAVVTVIGTALGLVFAKTRFRGKELLYAGSVLPLVLPPTVTGYYLILLLGRQGPVGGPLYALTGWSITFTWLAAVVAASIIAMPLMVISARAAIEAVDSTLEIASYTLGKSRMTTFFRITLPLAARGILAGIVLSFARAFGEFGATLMLAGNIPGRTQTMPLAIFEAVVAGEDERAGALAAILTALSILVVYLTSRLAPAPGSARRP